MKVEVKELKISNELQKRIDMICRFAGVSFAFSNGCVKNIKETNIAYVKPHILSVNGNDYLIFEECDDNHLYSENNINNIIKDTSKEVELTNYTEEKDYDYF